MSRKRDEVEGKVREMVGFRLLPSTIDKIKRMMVLNNCNTAGRLVELLVINSKDVVEHTN